MTDKNKIYIWLISVIFSAGFAYILWNISTNGLIGYAFFLIFVPLLVPLIFAYKHKINSDQSFIFDWPQQASLAIFTVLTVIINIHLMIIWAKFFGTNAIGVDFGTIHWAQIGDYISSPSQTIGTTINNIQTGGVHVASAILTFFFTLFPLITTIPIYQTTDKKIFYSQILSFGILVVILFLFYMLVKF